MTYLNRSISIRVFRRGSGWGGGGRTFFAGLRTHGYIHRCEHPNRLRGGCALDFLFLFIIFWGGKGCNEQRLAKRDSCRSRDVLGGPCCVSNYLRSIARPGACDVSCTVFGARNNPTNPHAPTHPPAAHFTHSPGYCMIRAGSL